MRLCFTVPARCVRFLQTPSHFFQVSSFLISRAERRVALAALYVGSGPRERFLVDLLRKRMQDVACRRECDRPGGLFRDFLWREGQTGAGRVETVAARAGQRRGGQRREANNAGSERMAISARTEREGEADFESRRRKLQVDILVDHLRGTRTDKTGCSSASVLAPLLKRKEVVSDVDVQPTVPDSSSQFRRPGNGNSSNSSALKASSSSSSVASPSSSFSPSRSSACSSPSFSSSPSSASFSGEEDVARISFFHNPLASSLLGRLLPPRVNEVLGVQHVKALVVDDTVLLTGANFSEEYMVNRADRYVVVNDAAVAQAVCRLIQTVQRGSFCLRLREQRRGEEAPAEAEATRGRVSEAAENRTINAETAAGGEETGTRGLGCVPATRTETRLAHGGGEGREGGEERFAGLGAEAKNGGKTARSRSGGEDDFDVVWDPQFTLTSNPTQDPAAFSRDFYRLLKEACESVSSTAFLASGVKPYNAMTETVSCTPSTQSKDASRDAGHPATRGQVPAETAEDSGVCTLELALQAGFTNPPVDDLARVLDEIFVEAGIDGSPSGLSGSELMKNSPNAEESTHAAPHFRPASRSEEDPGRASTGASSGRSFVVSEDEKEAAPPRSRSGNGSTAVVLASPYLNLPTRLLRRLVALCAEHSDAVESRPEVPRAARELAATSGICDEVLRSRKVAVVTASPQANSFHKSKGVSRYIPEAYAYVAYRLARLLEPAAHETPSAGRGLQRQRHPSEARASEAEAAPHAQRELCSDRLSEKSIGSSRQGSEAVALQATGGRPPACQLVFEYCSPGWTFHTKGIWLFADEKTQERRKAVCCLPGIPDRMADGATGTARHQELVDPQREEGCFSFSSASSCGRNSSEFLSRTSHSVRQKTCKAEESSGLTVRERGGEETPSVELRARSRTAGSDLEEERKARGDSPAMLPYLTVFGSSNFSERAEHRDLDLSCVLRTRDHDLQKQMKAEVEQVLKHSKPVEAESVKKRFGWVTLLAVQWRLVKSLL